jgi:hypothetical protein
MRLLFEFLLPHLQAADDNDAYCDHSIGENQCS